MKLSEFERRRGLYCTEPYFLGKMFAREKLITRTYSEAFFMFLRKICQYLVITLVKMACNLEIILTYPGPGYLSVLAETRQK